MRLRIAVVVAVVASSLLGSANAQQATAYLLDVESGRIDAAHDTERREMCLRAGLYVLASARGRLNGNGVVILYTGTPDQIEETVLGAVLRESDQSSWSWKSFDVDGRTCFHIGASNARARVYEVRIGVDW